MEPHFFSPKGRKEAFEKLAAESEKQVYAVCYHMMGSREDAMDCAQEAMLRAYRGFSSFRGQAQGATWLIRIAMNVCMDEIRKRKKVYSLEALRERAGFDPPDPRRGQQERLEEKERKAMLREGLLHLPEEERALIILRDMQGLPYDEIASLLSLPLGTVKSRLSRARQKLSAFLRQSSELFSAPSV